MKYRGYDVAGMIRYAVFNGGMIALTAFGLYGGVTWCLNIALFIVWLSVVQWTVLLIGIITDPGGEYQQKLIERGRIVPREVSAMTDFTVALLFVAAGVFFYGALCMIQWILMETMYLKIEKIRNEGDSDRD